jgi:Domain of unknown function (DUF3331)
MLDHSAALDPWLRTVDMLKATNRARPDAMQKLSIVPRAAPCSVAGLAVKVVDRPTPTTIIVAWCDPQSCRYLDQVWRSSTARRQGTCALSGMQIQRGDAIYRPRACHPTPLNADAMMLAGCIQPCGEDPVVRLHSVARTGV